MNIRKVLRYRHIPAPQKRTHTAGVAVALSRLVTSWIAAPAFPASATTRWRMVSAPTAGSWAPPTPRSTTTRHLSALGISPHARTGSGRGVRRHAYGRPVRDRGLLRRPCRPVRAQGHAAELDHAGLWPGNDVYGVPESWSRPFDQQCPARYGQTLGGAFVETYHHESIARGYLAGLNTNDTPTVGDTDPLRLPTRRRGRQ